MLISQTKAGSKGDRRALVTVTASGKYQLRIAFNSALMRQMNLRTFQIAIDWDDTNNRLTFITDVGDTYGGGFTFPVSNDGGAARNLKAKAIYLGARILPFLKPGKYEPEHGEIIGGDGPDCWGSEDMRHPTISISPT